MNKTAIITGATGSGIGRSSALALARDGYNIVLNYHSNEENAVMVTETVKSLGVQVISVKADIFNQNECELLINETLRHFNRIDVLVIGPGANWNPEPPDKIQPEKVLMDTIQEVSPVYSFLPHILPIMEQQKAGRIIGIASNTRIPSPSYSYNSAKDARIAALLGIVNHCWKHRITVNVISPGPVEHIENMAKAIEINRDFSKSEHQISPQDIAEIVSFLCSEKGRYVTGNVIGTYF